MLVTVRELNEADQDAFVDAVGFVFEDTPWIAAQAWYNRPFADRAALYEVLRTVMWEAPEPLQLALIRAHPDLVGSAALAETLTPSSTREQAAAGLDRLTAEDVAAFSQFNAAYKERFGFPFVICARQNKKDAILAAFPERLAHTPSQEVQTALAEIAKIARLRLEDSVVD